MFHVHQCDEFKDFGADEGKTGACDGSFAQQAYLVACGQEWMRGHVHHSGAFQGQRAVSKRRRGPGTLREEGDEEGLMCLGNGTLQQGAGSESKLRRAAAVWVFDDYRVYLSSGQQILGAVLQGMQSSQALNGEKYAYLGYI